MKLFSFVFWIHWVSTITGKAAAQREDTIPDSTVWTVVGVSVLVVVLVTGIALIVVCVKLKMLRDSSKTLLPPPRPCKIRRRPVNTRVTFRQTLPALPADRDSCVSVDSNSYQEIDDELRPRAADNQHSDSDSYDSDEQCLRRIACPSTDSSDSESYAVAYGCTVVDTSAPGYTIKAIVHHATDSDHPEDDPHPLHSVAEARNVPETLSTRVTTPQRSASANALDTALTGRGCASVTPPQPQSCPFTSHDYLHPIAPPLEGRIAPTGKIHSQRQHCSSRSDDFRHFLAPSMDVNPILTGTASPPPQPQSCSLTTDEYLNPVASTSEAAATIPSITERTGMPSQPKVCSFRPDEYTGWSKKSALFSL